MYFAHSSMYTSFKYIDPLLVRLFRSFIIYHHEAKHVRIHKEALKFKTAGGHSLIFKAINNEIVNIIDVKYGSLKTIAREQW